MRIHIEPTIPDGRAIAIAIAFGAAAILGVVAFRNSQLGPRTTTPVDVPATFVPGAAPTPNTFQTVPPALTPTSVETPAPAGNTTAPKLTPLFTPAATPPPAGSAGGGRVPDQPPPGYRD
jgi:hypothetical protein